MRLALSEPTHLARSPGKAAAQLSALADLAGLRHKLATPVLIYFLAILLPISFKLGPLTMTGVRLILIAMIIPLTLRLLSGSYGKVIITDIMFLLHVAWMAAALAINNPEQAIANTGSTGIEFIGGYVLGRAYIRSREDFLAMIRLISFVLICCMPLAIYETITGVSPIINILNKVPGINSLKDIEIGQRMGLNRVQMFLAHPIHFGLFCSIMLSLCWVGMQGIYSNSTRIFVCAAATISGILALSSGALLAIVLQFGLFFWAWIFRKTKFRWMILFGLCVIAYVVVDLLSNRTPLHVFMSYATFSPFTAYARVLIFEYGIQNIKANPFFGIGLNDWVRPSWMTSSVDNFWLLIALRYGIPSFAMLVVGYFVALWKIGRRDFDGDIVLWQFRRAWMFSFLGLTFTLTTVHVWHNMYSFVFFMFGSGMWMMTAMPKTWVSLESVSSSSINRSMMIYNRSKLYNLPRAGVSSDQRPKKDVVEESDEKAVLESQHVPKRGSRTASAPYTRFTNKAHRQTIFEQMKPKKVE